MIDFYIRIYTTQTHDMATTTSTLANTTAPSASFVPSNISRVQVFNNTVLPGL